MCMCTLPVNPPQERGWAVYARNNHPHSEIKKKNLLMILKLKKKFYLTYPILYTGIVSLSEA